MGRFRSFLLSAGFVSAALLLIFTALLVIPSDEAWAHDDNPATRHAENYSLHKAAEAGDLDAVNHFVTVHMANVDAKNDNYHTPIYLAAILGHVPVVSALIAAGTDVNMKNDSGNTPLDAAAKYGHVSIVSALIAAGAEVNVKDDLGYTPIFSAAFNGHVSVVSVLIAAGADVNARDNYNTPLDAAVRDGHISIVSVLITAGAEVNAKNDFDWTPLHWAVFKGNALAVSLLLAAGAYVNAKTDKGHTPLDIAKGNKNWDIVILLERNVRKILQKSRAEIGNAASIFENTWRSVVVVYAGDTQGGGVILGGPNQVATNCHVVDEAPYDIRVYKGEERQANRDKAYSAEIVAGDRKRDICLLMVSGLWGIAAEIRAAMDLEIGEAVYAVGAPQGFDFSISDGIVSQLRTIEGESAPLIQTSAAISPGSSGGGLFDSQGRLVGLTTWKIREGENLNFAVPVDWALELY